MRYLFAGWGFQAGALAESFESCWTQAVQTLDCAGSVPCRWTFALLATRSQTCAARALQDWANQIRGPIDWKTWTEDAIARVATPSRSARLQQRFATGSVAEALALRASSALPHARLLVLRTVSEDRRATLAIAGVTPPTSLIPGVMP
ncbi:MULTISPECIES: cobalamin biosynthesis protein [Comamonas]|uniref:cobalamin biosynthesis protein n=1 Tax=Comamonas TaxID=283 RepID=UPI0012CCEEFC|nr:MULTISPECIES: cobalamin biosynthesis protein [Comamonas]MDR3065928.1 cobalamin biosynthesis protein [Comamonas sp.]MEB5964928.1 cobalamin biosynthesis protein [Comamonas testosteroni]MPS93938.1 cobalamin biosynthesis protein [Comamonas sp.]